MRVGIIGGTGKEGSGLAIRWARAGHDVAIGSRSAERGVARAAELSEAHGVTVSGGGNEDAVKGADIVVLSVPYGAHAATLQGLRGVLAGKLMVDITVPLKPPKVRTVHLPEGQAAALEAQALLDESTTVAAGLHHVGSAHLADPEHAIACDVLVCCDDRAARERVMALVADLGMRALDAGRLRNAIALESLTPVLIHMNKRYGGPGAGIQITGLPD